METRRPSLFRVHFIRSIIYFSKIISHLASTNIDIYIFACPIMFKDLYSTWTLNSLAWFANNSAASLLFRLARYSVLRLLHFRWELSKHFLFIFLESDLLMAVDHSLNSQVSIALRGEKKQKKIGALSSLC